MSENTNIFDYLVCLSNMIAHHLLVTTLILLEVVLVSSNRNTGASFSPIREVSTKNIDIYIDVRGLLLLYRCSNSPSYHRSIP